MNHDIIETSAEVNELFAALAKAQGAIKPALKKAINPAFARGQSEGSYYADLAACAEAVREPLKASGLALLQPYAGAHVVTILVHESGQWIRGSIQIPNFDNLSPQQIGSATTYLRRYSFGMVGLVTEKDDDGNKIEDAHHDLKHYTQDEVQKYVSRFTDALNLDALEPEIAAKVKAIHNEMRGRQELALAVSAAMGTQANAVRDYLNIHKKLETAMKANLREGAHG